MQQLIYSRVDGYLGTSTFSLFWTVLQQTLPYITPCAVQQLPWVYSKPWESWAVGHMHLLLNTVPICSPDGSHQFTLPAGGVWHDSLLHTFTNNWWCQICYFWPVWWVWNTSLFFHLYVPWSTVRLSIFSSLYQPYMFLLECELNCVFFFFLLCTFLKHA